MRTSQRSVPVAIAVAVLCSPAASLAQSVALANLRGIQPGWVRATVVYDASFSPSFRLVPTCDPGTSPESVKSTTAVVFDVQRTAYVDLRADLPWLADNGLPVPCRVTALRLEMLNGGNVVAIDTKPVAFPMDLPLSHLTTGNAALGEPLTSVPLQRAPGTSRWAAYPARLIALRSSATSFVNAIIEVEELPSRGTVGLRGLSTFGIGLSLELGGGAEVFPGWGIDVDEFGVTKNTTGPEESNPGHHFYPWFGVEPPLLNRNPLDLVLPSPPYFTEATYLDQVLDNRHVARCPGGACLDVVYDAATHSLVAANGAVLYDLDPGPVPDPPLGNLPQRPYLLPAYERLLLADLQATLRAVRAGQQLPSALYTLMSSPTRNPEFPILDYDAKNLDASSAQTAFDPSLPSTVNDWSSVVASRFSPQEFTIRFKAGNVNSSVLVISPIASCKLNSTNTGVTAPIRRCAGFSAFPFRCPTAEDPLRPQDLPRAPGTGGEVGLLDTIPPYYAARDNRMGTCGSHSFQQYYEALLAKYTDDLAPKRVVYVDGLPITVPVPRISTSIASGLWSLYNWSGTHVGDPDLLPSTCLLDIQCTGGGVCCVPGKPGCTRPDLSTPPLETGSCRLTWPDPAADSSIKGMMPLFADAYWPARERDWQTWASSANVPENCKRSSGFWASGFCIAQGQPPPGVYRQYQRMSETLNAGLSPLREVPWSLANTYVNVITRPISLEDRDVAIQNVIKELQKGLPVALSFASGAAKFVYDGSGTADENKFTLADGPTWYLPPELGACERAALDAAFGPTNGHAVNIVGYSVDGPLNAPNAFNSYFVIQNNWGKRAGYKSFFFMNFAAFKYLAFGLSTHRLDATCWSEACARRPITDVPRIALRRFLIPPDPAGPISRLWESAMRDLLPYLAGDRTFSNEAPDIAGVSYLPPLSRGIIIGEEGPPILR